MADTLQGHWLAGQVEALDRLSGGSRPEFLRAVEEVVERVAARPDITASFAAYEGLLVATAGALPEVRFDALAAAAQQAMEGAGTDLLGPLDQMVLVGAADKLAILRVGPILLGILSPRGSSIARSTS